VKRFTLAILLIAAACTRGPEPRRYQLTGQVISAKPDGTELVVHHDDIKGFMSGMTMTFQVKDPAPGKAPLPGDLIRATLFVTDESSWLSSVEKTGWAPIAPTGPTAPPVASLTPGEMVADETLIDQDGHAFRVSSLKGAALLVTFVYTRCPLPDFCPRMDAHFGVVQKAIKEGRLKGPVRLLSISFDPDFDTPAVLKAHAARLGADPKIWTYATAPRERVEAWGAPMGLSVIRDAANPSDVTHNMRTAVIDSRGRLVTVLEGNGWTPDQAIAALSSAAPAR
jgi:protein SCO1